MNICLPILTFTCAVLIAGGDSSRTGPDGLPASSPPSQAGSPAEQGIREKDDTREAGQERRRGRSTRFLDDEQLEVVERFLEMPPERLAAIRGILMRIEQMSEEEKATMQTQIAHIRALPPEEKSRMREEYMHSPPEDRLLFRSYWRSLSTEEAQDLQLKMQSMSPEERGALRKQIIEKARQLELKPTRHPGQADRPIPEEMIKPPPKP